jgi:hypothetical protein
MKYTAAFAVLAIVAMGVAGIATGVGYTASTTTTENDISLEYIVADVGESLTGTFSITGIEYSTRILIDTDGRHATQYYINDSGTDEKEFRLTGQIGEKTAAVSVKLLNDLDPSIKLKVEFLKLVGSDYVVFGTIDQLSSEHSVAQGDDGDAEFGLGTYKCRITATIEGLLDALPNDFDLEFKASVVA